MRNALQGSVDIFDVPGLDDALYLFAAQTLRSKACKELQELGSQGYAWLRDQVVQLMGKQPHAPVLQRYLCLTLVALVVQWEEWSDALGFLRKRMC